MSEKTLSKKRNFVFIAILLIVVKIGIEYRADILLKIDELKYNYYTSRFELLETEELKGIINSSSKESIIYIGRSSCPDCLNQIININSILEGYQNDNYTAYYYDTTNKQGDESHIDLLETLNIKYVPTIVINENNNIKLLDYNDIGNIKQ